MIHGQPNIKIYVFYTLAGKGLNASHILSWVRGKVKPFLHLMKHSSMRVYGGMMLAFHAFLTLALYGDKQST